MSMKRVNMLGILLASLPLTGLRAENTYVLNVNLTDGSKMQFLVEQQKPTASFGKGEMVVNYTSLSKLSGSDGELAWLSFSRDEVESLTVDFIDPTSIRDTQSDNSQLQFEVTRGSIVNVSGLRDGDYLQVVSLDGRALQIPIAQFNGEASVDLSRQPSGCYIVSVNKLFTFKLMKR